MSKPHSAKFLPQDIGVIHFVGIGGIGMSGIAEILNNLGYKVQGSDASNNANVQRLEKLGITVKIGQDEENIKNAAVVVVSSAIKDDNPELFAARKAGIPVIKRAEMLAELMRLKTSVAIAGTHGKTTTTSMMAAMFEALGLQPTVVNGGIINAYGTNAKLGSGDWLLAEADESDGTFLTLPATIGVITNIEPEHMEHYGSFDVLRDAFKTFINRLPFYGFGVLCNDHPEVSKLLGKITDRRVFSYGIDSDADIKAQNIKYGKGGYTYDIKISDHLPGGEREIKGLKLPMPGKHNVQNSLAVITVALALGFDDQDIVNGFKDFQGVKRRFTETGVVDDITIIDDYGHHPTEIAATLQTAKEVMAESGGKLIAVAQPHRYSRVKDLFDDFCQCFDLADTVVVTPIYEAGEKPIAGITQDSLAKGIKDSGHKDVQILGSEKELAKVINDIANPGDYVICLGAGSISLWANSLPEELAELRKKQAS